MPGRPYSVLSKGERNLLQLLDTDALVLHYENVYAGRFRWENGPEGMDLVSRIIKEAPDWLAPGGLLLMEIDDTQEELVRAACEECGRYASFAVLRDLAGKIRYLKARI